MLEVSEILNRFDNMVAVSVFLNKLLTILAVSEIFNRFDNISVVSLIFNFILILVFNALELSIIKVLSLVESDLILFLKIVTLSTSDDPVEAPNIFILFDKLIVSFPIRLLNMVEVSEILSLLNSMVKVSDILSLLLNIVDVSDILSLLFNIAVVSLKFNFKAKESDACSTEDKLKASQAELFNKGVFSLYKVSTDCTKTNIPNFLLS